MDPKEALSGLLAAVRALRLNEEALLGAPQAELVPILEAAVGDAMKVSDLEEQEAQLMALATLCAQVEGPEMADTLFSILDHDVPEVRADAGEALTEVGFSRYKELALLAEREIEAGTRTNALKELPWILVEIAEPTARPLIERLLTHPSADVAASAIEALVELGEPQAMRAISALIADTRDISEEGFEEETAATVGQLAEEAVGALSSLLGDLQDMNA